jgi:hypothetical protein
MAYPAHLRSLLLAAVAMLLPAGVAAAQTDTPAEQSQTKHEAPLPLKPDLPGLATNHRLILKDGTYQIVRKYEIVGDRVRYISIERSGDWEELPVDLVDWDATRKWERDHTDRGANGTSPAMKEAEDIDKEEATARADQQARMPEVSRGLELPDREGVFVLDTYQGTPELVELVPCELAINAKTKHGLSMLNPLAGAKANLELEGAHAKVHLHVNDPAFYLSLDTPDDNQPLLTHALTVQVRNSKPVVNGKHGANSALSGFAIVRADERQAVRIVGAIHLSPTGAVTQDENVMAAKAEVMPGKHWLKLTPQNHLVIGEYTLVEILSADGINQAVWDFRVDPRMGDNPGSIGPILK